MSEKVINTVNLIAVLKRDGKESDEIYKKAKDHYCDSLEAWSELMIERERAADEYYDTDHHEFENAARVIKFAIHKSCLLDRMINGGEKLSKTPCPVHKGRWSGMHGPWPGDYWVDTEGNRTEAVASEQCQEWYDAGCRCFQHCCGCTTGWQPDEHCGCVTK